MSLLELAPQKVKPYLKLLTEATVHLSQNKGSMRKDIWDYLYAKYQDSIDYRDFLLALRKFKNEGKLINDDGVISMHSMVLQEVRDKTPTPAFGAKEGSSNIFQALQSKQSEIKTGDLVGSKISNSGKQQKIKGRIINLGKPDLKKDDSKSKLGFQTPIAQIKKSPKIPKITQLSEQKQRAPVDAQGIYKKYQKQQNFLKTQKRINSHISELSKRIVKSKKIITVPQKQVKPVPKPVQKKEEQEQKTQSPVKTQQKKEEQEKPEKKVLNNYLKKRIDNAIKNKNLKLRGKVVHQSQRKALRKRQEDIYKKGEKRVRKTLNLTKALDKKKEQERKTPEKPKKEQKQIEHTPKKSEQKSKKGQAVPKTLRSSAKKHQKVSEKRTKPIQKASPKKEEKVQKKAKKTLKIKRTLTKKQRLEKIISRLVNGLPIEKIGKDRKAKLHAVKTIKQLYLNSKTRSQMFVDEMMIYI